MTRFWNPRLGMGSLDLAPALAVFTPDSGPAPLRIRWAKSRTGPGDERARPRRKAELLEWQQWITITSAEGESFVFRRGGPPAHAREVAS